MVKWISVYSCHWVTGGRYIEYRRSSEWPSLLDRILPKLEHVGKAPARLSHLL